MPGYGGTLAAARCLGRAGIPVVVASEAMGQPAAWSRWATRRVRCPPPLDADRFLEWLLRFGERERERERPHVLYPTCDALAFLFARHADELGRHFLLYQPPFATLRTLLDKGSLTAIARRAGLETPATWLPANEGDLERIGGEARFPLLIKPRTQVLLDTLNKGLRVERAADLAAAYRGYVRSNTYAAAAREALPEAMQPMLQEYHPQSEDDVHSVAGFLDSSGQLFVARAASKVLQQPRRVGVGVCFEDEPLDFQLTSRIAALCRATGYFGVFELELISVGERRLLIDFNPRFYNQMAFDIARGMPLPLLVYLGALGDQAALEAQVRAAAEQVERPVSAYCNRMVLGMMIAADTLANPARARHWRSWRDRHHGSIVDAAFEQGDRLPGVLAVAQQVRSLVRHPRAFLRGLATRQ